MSTPPDFVEVFLGQLDDNLDTLDAATKRMPREMEEELRQLSKRPPELLAAALALNVTTTRYFSQTRPQPHTRLFGHMSMYGSGVQVAIRVREYDDEVGAEWWPAWPTTAR